MGNCLSSSISDSSGEDNFKDHNGASKDRYANSMGAHKLQSNKLHHSNRASNKGDLEAQTINGDSVRYSNPFTEPQTPPSSCRSSAAGSLLESHVSVRAATNSMRISASGISLRSSMARMKPSQHPGLRVNPESPLTGEDRLRALVAHCAHSQLHVLGRMMVQLWVSDDADLKSCSQDFKNKVAATSSSTKLWGQVR